MQYNNTLFFGMITMKFLKFDDSIDFPFYDENPRISKKGWFILLISIPLSLVLYAVVSKVTDSSILAGMAFCFTMLIPILYFAKWDYGLMFRKPTKSEIMLAVLMFIGYMLYCIVISHFLDEFGLSGVARAGSTMGITIESTLGLIFSMMAEELLKFIPLMFLMRVVYKYTHKRRLAIVTSTAIVLFIFGLMHYNPPYLTIASVLAIQGAGSFFDMYGYLRTKNLFVPYITHLLTDGIIFILILLGLA